MMPRIRTWEEHWAQDKRTALTWDGSATSQAEIVTWSRGQIEGFFGGTPGHYYLRVPTLHGDVKAVAGDQIVRVDRGVFRVLKGSP